MTLRCSSPHKSITFEFSHALSSAFQRLDSKLELLFYAMRWKFLSLLEGSRAMLLALTGSRRRGLLAILRFFKSLLQGPQTVVDSAVRNVFSIDLGEKSHGAIKVTQVLVNTGDFKTQSLLFVLGSPRRTRSVAKPLQRQ